MTSFAYIDVERLSTTLHLMGELYLLKQEERLSG
jgi:hypothetical protein